MLPFFSGLSHRRDHCIFPASNAPSGEDAAQIRRMPCPTNPMSLICMRKPAFARPGRRSSGQRSPSPWRSASPAAADFGYGYFTTGRYLESTDDAYVKANSTIISPKVSGYIAQVLVGDNQPVKAGQMLARIDDRDFRTALKQAQADVAGSEAAVRNLDAQIALQQPIIEQGTADVAAAEANLKFAQEERARYDELMKSGSGTIQRAQQTDAALREKNAQVQHGQSGLLAAQEEGRRPHHRPRQGGGATRSRAGGRAAGGAEPVLHGDIGPGRRHRRRPLAAGRSVRAGGNAVDGGGTARRGLCGGEFQGNPAHQCAQRPAGRNPDRQFPRHQADRVTSTACRRRAGSNSRCCRRTTPPAISPRSCSGCR